MFSYKPCFPLSGPSFFVQKLSYTFQSFPLFFVFPFVSSLSPVPLCFSPKETIFPPRSVESRVSTKLFANCPHFFSTLRKPQAWVFTGSPPPFIQRSFLNPLPSFSFKTFFFLFGVTTSGVCWLFFPNLASPFLFRVVLSWFTHHCRRQITDLLRLTLLLPPPSVWFSLQPPTFPLFKDPVNWGMLAPFALQISTAPISGGAPFFFFFFSHFFGEPPIGYGPEGSFFRPQNLSVHFFFGFHFFFIFLTRFHQPPKGFPGGEGPFR